MNTKSMGHNAVIGAVMASLIMGAVAFTPFAAHAETGGTKTKKTVDLTCMQTAVGTREDAIIKAFEGFTTDTTDALKARKSALNDGWAMADGPARKAAIKKAWMDWKSAKKEAHTDLKSARKTAWDTFKTTAKTTCKVVTPKEEALEKDSAGSVSL
jgi:hypothetical protein